MKSIANQYLDLKEGKMSQFNFMRSLRMTMPQYITNVTSFNDAVKILRNKAILTETLNENSRAFDVAKALRDKYQMDAEGIYVYLIDDMGLDNMTAQSVVDQLFSEDDEEDEMSDLIKKIGQEEEEEKAIKGGFGIQDPLEEDRTDDELNQAFLTFLKNIYAKSPTDKIEQMIADQEAKMGISKEEIPMFKGTRDALDSLSIREGKKKKESKKELHPNAIHPQELRMGIKVELEHTDDLDKAKKIALDHLAENPFYYTALKLAGVESPSAPKVKAPVEKKAKKRKEAVELVDKINAMQKVKMPKKVVNEVRINAMPGKETNATIKQAMQYIDSDIANPTLKAISDKLELQPLRDNRAILRYGYWEKMPDEALAAVKKQFNVEEDIDTEEEKADSYIYIISSKNKVGNLGSSLEMGANKASQMDAFKEALEKLVRETLAETFDGRDNLTDVE